MAHLLSESNYRKRFRQFDCSINPQIFQGFLKIFRFAQFHIGMFGNYAQRIFQVLSGMPWKLRILKSAGLTRLCACQTGAISVFYWLPFQQLVSQFDHSQHPNSSDIGHAVRRRIHPYSGAVAHNEIQAVARWTGLYIYRALLDGSVYWACWQYAIIAIWY